MYTYTYEWANVRYSVGVCTLSPRELANVRYNVIGMYIVTTQWANVR